MWCPYFQFIHISLISCTIFSSFAHIQGKAVAIIPTYYVSTIAKSQFNYLFTRASSTKEPHRGRHCVFLANITRRWCFLLLHSLVRPRSGQKRTPLHHFPLSDLMSQEMICFRTFFELVAKLIVFQQKFTAKLYIIYISTKASKKV